MQLIVERMAFERVLVLTSYLGDRTKALLDASCRVKYGVQFTFDILFRHFDAVTTK